MCHHYHAYVLQQQRRLDEGLLCLTIHHFPITPLPSNTNHHDFRTQVTNNNHVVSNSPEIQMEKKVGEANKRYYGSALFWWLTVSIVAVLVVGAGVFTIITKFHFHHHSHSTKPTNVVHKYASALQLALQFFDVQKGILF